MYFFIDTANFDEIQEVTSWLGTDSFKCLGITTNPNAINKIGIATLCDLKKHLAKLLKLAHNRFDSNFQLYVQYPSTNVTAEQIEWFINELSHLNIDAMGFKIPPNPALIKQAILMSDNINVTGIADAATVINCLGIKNVHEGVCGKVHHKIRFASIIPGRMEEAGIDADAHLDYIRNTNDTADLKNRVITGSMRTIDGLRRAIGYQTVPTIGYKVWKLIMEKYSPTEFIGWFDDVLPTQNKWYSPLVTQTNYDLSNAFFKQMDTAGDGLRHDLERCFY